KRSHLPSPSPPLPKQAALPWEAPLSRDPLHSKYRPRRQQSANPLRPLPPQIDGRLPFLKLLVFRFCGRLPIAAWPRRLTRHCWLLCHSGSAELSYLLVWPPMSPASLRLRLPATLPLATTVAGCNCTASSASICFT